MHDRSRLSRDLHALGLTAGDTVMVHASVRAVGEIAGGPDEIHLAIKDVITSTGTLMMYASCPQYVDEVGRGNLSPAREAELLEKLPAFDPQTSRSARDNGARVELLRTWPGSRVNPHVVRFVAWGRHAEDLFVLQPWDYAFGRGSALERFLELDGKLLLLGCDHTPSPFFTTPSTSRTSRASACRATRCPSSRTERACGGGSRRSTRVTAARTRTGPTASSRGSSTRI